MKTTQVRLWVEILLAAIFAVLFVVTLVWPDWIELVLKVDPDEGDGSLESWIMIGTGALTLIALVCAGIDWRRLRASAVR
jgi:hypothetical protein